MQPVGVRVTIREGDELLLIMGTSSHWNLLRTSHAKEKDIPMTLKRTPDTVWQLLSQLSDFISLKNRHCELWGTMPPCSLQEA